MQTKNQSMRRTMKCQMVTWIILLTGAVTLFGEPAPSKVKILGKVTWVAASEKDRPQSWSEQGTLQFLSTTGTNVLVSAPVTFQINLQRHALVGTFSVETESLTLPKLVQPRVTLRVDWGRGMKEYNINLRTLSLGLSRNGVLDVGELFYDVKR